MKNGIDDLKKAGDDFKKELREYEDYVSQNARKYSGAESMPGYLKKSIFRRYTRVARYLENLLAQNQFVRDEVFRVTQARFHASDDPTKFDLQEDAAASAAVDDQFHKIVQARDYIDELLNPIVDPEAKQPGQQPSGYEYADHKGPVDAYQYMACKDMK